MVKTAETQALRLWMQYGDTPIEVTTNEALRYYSVWYALDDKEKYYILTGLTLTPTDTLRKLIDRLASGEEP